MASGRPLFPGSTVEDQLQLIFSILGKKKELQSQRAIETLSWTDWTIFLAGTPTEETWPGITNNEEFMSYHFDHCAPQSLIHRAPRLDGEGFDLLNKFLGVSALLLCLLFYKSIYNLSTLPRLVRGQKANLSSRCNEAPVLPVTGLHGAQITWQ